MCKYYSCKKFVFCRTVSMALSAISVAFQQLETIKEKEEQEDQNLIPGYKKILDKLRLNLVSINDKLTEEIEMQMTTLDKSPSDLEELKDVAYEINDATDQWISAFEMSKKEQKEGTQTEASPILKKMRSFIPPMQCFSHAARCSNIVHKIEQVNRNVARLAEKRIIDLKVQVLPKEDAQLAMSRTEPCRSALENIFLGRYKDIDVLIGKLLEEVEQQDCAVICISGVPGIGKTTLARSILEKQEVKKHFENRLLWVSVSKPFEEVKVAKAIIKEFEGVSTHTNELAPLLKRIRSLIKDSKFLLVLDNICADGYIKKGQLEKCLRSNAARGSRILVTTDEKVPKEMDNVYTHPLDKLSKEHSEMLFLILALHSRSNGECEKLLDAAKTLANNCDRLPLALKTLGCLMRKKKEKDWNAVLESKYWKLAGKETPYPPFMLLCYYEMPPVLRHCFTCCALFPKHERIEKATLVKLWMAHGFLRRKESEKEKLAHPYFDMEKIGDSYFNRLAERACFQDLEEDKYTGEIVSFRLHETMHDFARALLGKEFILEEATERRTLSSREDAEAEAGGNRNSNRTKAEATTTDTKVRTLWIRQASKPGNLNEDLVSQFKCLTSLRVLNLSDSLITDIPKEVGELIHLRYLNFSKNKHLKALPAELCKLHNLQTINVNWCLDLAELPQGIGRLKNLRHFENLGTYKLNYLPKGIADLASLQTLLRFPISVEHEEKACKLEELNGLRNLTNKLGIVGLGNLTLTENSDFKKVNLNKEGLVKLELVFSSSKKITGPVKDEEIIRSLQVHVHLKDLVLAGYRGASLSFDWLLAIRELRRLELIRCPGLKSLPPLGGLPHLTFLHIQGMRNVKKIDAEFLGIPEDGGSTSQSFGFPNLKCLELWGMKRLKSWDFNHGGHARNIKIMPKLCFLTFQSCPKLQRIPSFIRSCKRVKELNIRWCSSLEETYKPGGGEWSCISHIENIIVNHRCIKKGVKYPCN